MGRIGQTLLNRKNKTLSSIFKQKKLLMMIEKNLKTFRSLQAMDIDNDSSDDTANVLTPSAKARLDVALANGRNGVKSLVEEVLGDMADMRSTNISIDGFLTLLGRFNEAGIHFNN